MRRSVETRQDASPAVPEALAVCPECLSLGLATIIIARFDEARILFLKNGIYVTNVPLAAGRALSQREEETCGVELCSESH